MDGKKVILSLENVGLFYKRKTGLLRRDKFWALRDVSFDLCHGETLGIIGKNGVGKSTLLRLIAGIIAPDMGEVIRHERLRASLLALQVGFIPHLTGRQNAILGSLLLGLRRSDVDSLLPRIFEFSELGDFIDQPVHSYSTGMKARLGFSVALYADPDILLVDEVLGVGDADFLKKSADAIREISKSNKTVVIVSHNNQLVRSLCDRVVWIENGHTQGVGSTESILEQYQQAHAAVAAKGVPDPGKVALETGRIRSRA
jgi:lipopolysaccharide transport system ATP-binding protein